MIWKINYEKIDNTRVNTTLITKEANEKIVVERFEKMHKHRVTVIECKPKYKTETPKQKQARLNAFERDLLPVKHEDSVGWKLNRVDAIEWVEDKSGVYVVINWDMLTDSVRLDFMAKDSTPLQSFIGDSDDVRKAAIAWVYAKSMISFPNAEIQISMDHAAYIGAELERCDTERIDYIQS